MERDNGAGAARGSKLFTAKCGRERRLMQLFNAPSEPCVLASLVPLGKIRDAQSLAHRADGEGNC
jgi:hypothetical protein